MSTGIVSHDTDQMRNWSNTMDSNSGDYGSLIRTLYGLVEDFAGSSQFKGGLSSDFLNTFQAQKGEYLKYETTFNECAELIKNRAQNIDSDEAYLQSKINSGNPLA